MPEIYIYLNSISYGLYLDVLIRDVEDNVKFSDISLEGF